MLNKAVASVIFAKIIWVTSITSLSNTVLAKNLKRPKLMWHGTGFRHHFQGTNGTVFSEQCGSWCVAKSATDVTSSECASLPSTTRNRPWITPTTSWTWNPWSRYRCEDAALQKLRSTTSDILAIIWNLFSSCWPLFPASGCHATPRCWRLLLVLFADGARPGGGRRGLGMVLRSSGFGWKPQVRGRLASVATMFLFWCLLICLIFFLITNSLYVWLSAWQK